MMLHRHFEEEKRKKQREANGEFVSEIFDSDSNSEETEQPKRGRRKKTDD